MRPWILMKEKNIPFEEIYLRFDSFADNSEFKSCIKKLTPTGKVPVLMSEDVPIWDSLSITEYLFEKFPNLYIWPDDILLRTAARSLCAEIHAGFKALRSFCPMNIEASLKETGQELLQNHSDLARDLALLNDLLVPYLKKQEKSAYLFGKFSAVDAFYAPVYMRIVTYQLPISDELRVYFAQIAALSSVKAWIEEAKMEHDFRQSNEPYRKNR